MSTRETEQEIAQLEAMWANEKGGHYDHVYLPSSEQSIDWRGALWLHNLDRVVAPEGSDTVQVVHRRKTNLETRLNENLSRVKLGGAPEKHKSEGPRLPLARITGAFINPEANRVTIAFQDIAGVAHFDAYSYTSRLEMLQGLRVSRRPETLRATLP